MKIIKTDAVEPKPVKVEGSIEDTEEIFIFDTKGRFIGTEHRLTDVAMSEITGEPIE